MFPSPFTQNGSLFSKGALPVAERMTAFLEKRHEVISHNIANVDTRYYKNQDLPVEDFNRLLEKSLRARDNRHVKTFEFIHNSNVYPDWHGSQKYRIREADGGVLRHNDNNVDIDREMSKLARNQMMFKTMSRLAKKHYDQLRATIRETP